jgi:hypothetical protein
MVKASTAATTNLGDMDTLAPLAAGRTDAAWTWKRL